jgi:apolipoprotein N-acyltransferase
VTAGANVLVNLTNDAWYGKSSAPWHSLAMSVLRAVETRRTLIRSANTGISAFVTPLGTVSRQSELFVPWAAAAEVVLSEELTIWARYGYLFAPLCMLLGGCGGLVAIWRRVDEDDGYDNGSDHGGDGSRSGQNRLYSLS